MNGADLGNGEHGNGQLGDHGHVQHDPIALDHTQALEAVGELVDLLLEHGICDLLSGLIGGLRHEYIGYLILLGPLGVPVHTVMGHIALAAHEPLGIRRLPFQG